MEEGALHINIPSDVIYYSIIRQKGRRTWESSGPERNTEKESIMDMARKFSEGGWKRGVVMRKSEFYEPEIMVELSR